MEEMAMAYSSQLIAAEDVYPSTLEYRLHRLVTTEQGHEAVTVIYDGDQILRREYGKDYHQAIARAKAWIDEQDAPESDYDLHAADAKL